MHADFGMSAPGSLVRYFAGMSAPDALMPMVSKHKYAACISTLIISA